MRQRRGQIQDEIQQLNDQRQTYLAAQRAKLAETGHETLDTAIVEVVRNQAAQKKFDLRQGDSQ